MKLRLYLALVLASLTPAAFAAAQSAPSEAAPVEDGGNDPTDEEDAMIAAAVAEEEANAPRIGASLGVEAMRGLRAPNAGGLGASIAFTFKFENPRGIGQIGFTGWPADFYRGPSSAEERMSDWEMFLAATIYPFEWSPVDLGFYMLLAANSIVTSVADRVALGISVQWSFNDAWALRYQLGCSTESFTTAALVSTLAVDIVFPYI